MAASLGEGGWRQHRKAASFGGGSTVTTAAFVVLWLEYVCNFFTPCPNYFFAVFDVSWGKVRDGRREIW